MPVIHGAVAGQSPGEAADLSWVPDGAIAHLDFVGRRYWAGGAIRSDFDLLGGGYDATYLSNRGLLLTDDLGIAAEDWNTPNAIGPLFDDIVAAVQGNGARFVLEMDTDEMWATYGGPAITIADSADLAVAVDATRWEFDWNSDGSGWHQIRDDQGLLFGDQGETYQDGIQRIVSQFSFPVGNNWEYAVAANSGPVAPAVVNYGGAFFPANAVLLFHTYPSGFPMPNVHVRSLTLYPAGDKAELSALSDPDPWWNTILQIDASGKADGATIADESRSGYPLTNEGVSILGEEFIFGGDGDNLKFIKNFEGKILTPLNAPVAIEAFGVVFNSVDAAQDIWGTYDPIGNLRSHLLRFAGHNTPKDLRLILSADGINPISIVASFSPTIGVPYDFRVTRYGDDVWVHINGVLHTSATFSGPSFDAATAFRIGASGDATAINGLDGKMKAFRYTRRTARAASSGGYTPDSPPLFVGSAF